MRYITVRAVQQQRLCAESHQMATIFCFFSFALRHSTLRSHCSGSGATRKWVFVCCLSHSKIHIVTNLRLMISRQCHSNTFLYFLFVWLFHSASTTSSAADHMAWAVIFHVPLFFTVRLICIICTLCLQIAHTKLSDFVCMIIISGR